MLSCTHRKLGFSPEVCYHSVSYHVFVAEKLTLQQLGGAGTEGGISFGELPDVLSKHGPALAEGFGDVALTEVLEGPHPLHLSSKWLKQLQGHHPYTVHVRLKGRPQKYG